MTFKVLLETPPPAPYASHKERKVEKTTVASKMYTFIPERRGTTVAHLFVEDHSGLKNEEFCTRKGVGPQWPTYALRSTVA